MAARARPAGRLPAGRRAAARRRRAARPGTSAREDDAPRSAGSCSRWPSAGRAGWSSSRRPPARRPARRRSLRLDATRARERARLDAAVGPGGRARRHRRLVRAPTATGADMRAETLRQIAAYERGLSGRRPPLPCARMSIGIVGLGYVGLPLAVAFAEAGEDVIGVDVDPGKIAGLRDGPLAHRGHPVRAARRRSPDRIEFTTRAVDLHEAEAILVCVPTPLNRNREPDLGPLLGAARTLAGVIAQGQLVVLESTTFPGTTREHLVPLLEESGLVAGEDFALAFSPERVDPGRTDYTLAQHAEDRRRPHAGLHRARARGLRARLRRRSCRSPRPRSRSWRSCWRTSSARSTSRSSTSWRCSPTAWGSTSGRSSTPPRPSRSASCASSPARAWAATACRSTRST